MGCGPLGNALARDNQDTKLLFFDALVGNIPYDKALTDISRVKRKQERLLKLLLKPTLNTSGKCIIGFTEEQVRLTIYGKYKKTNCIA